MERISAVIISLVLAALPCSAQWQIGQRDFKSRAGGGSNTWTLVRHTLVLEPCGGTTSCTAAVSAIGSGNTLELSWIGDIAFINGGFGSTGGSWIHPGGSSAGACDTNNGSTGMSCAYVLHSTSCSSTCNITWTISAASTHGSVVISEWTPSTGSASYDTAGVGSGTFTTTPPGQPLTISGTSDLVIQSIAPTDNPCTAISSPYSTVSDFDSTTGVNAGYASAGNLSSVSAPTWTCSVTRYIITGVAFK